MNATKELADRIEEIYMDGKWIANTNLKEILSDVTHRQANLKISGLNTIASLTFHLNYYLSGLIQVLKGGKLEIRDKYSFLMPEITNESDWETMKKELSENAAVFAKLVGQLEEKILDEDFVDPAYGSYRRNIEGIIEHSYYHMGQMVLLKKLIQDGR